MKRGYAIPCEGEPFDSSFFYLGRPCKRLHVWACGQTLRVKKNRQCPACSRLDASERQRASYQDTDKRDKIRQRNREHAAKQRESLQKQGLTKRGTVPVRRNVQLTKAIRNAGKLPTVAKLVYQQQRDYWQDHPDDKRKHDNERRRQYGRWRHMTDETYRLYHRQKSKRRKALERGSIGIQVTGRQVQARYAQFDHRCAYCGATGDLHMDHLVPITKGGTHCLGNLIPACTACNFSKFTHEAETWYRGQSFFSEVRWRKIRRVLGMGRGPATQLALM